MANGYYEERILLSDQLRNNWSGAEPIFWPGAADEDADGVEEKPTDADGQPISYLKVKFLRGGINPRTLGDARRDITGTMQVELWWPDRLGAHGPADLVVDQVVEIFETFPRQSGNVRWQYPRSAQRESKSGCYYVFNIRIPYTREKGCGVQAPDIARPAC